MLELEADEGESLQKLKLNITRAAKEVSRPVEYGVSDEGTLLVWIRDAPRKTRRVKTGQTA
jgi:hypothetical protein